jgi:tetratricopeptide (TPR) repeat protein
MDGVSVASANLGDLYRFQGEYTQAEHYYNKSLTINRDYGMKADLAGNLYNLGLLALQQDDYPEALQYFNEFFVTARTVNGKKNAPELFIGLAAVAAGTNQPERAAKLFGAAQEMFAATGDRILPFDRAEFDRHIRIAQDQLGDAAFEALVTEGRQMTTDQAIAFALHA